MIGSPRERGSALVEFTLLIPLLLFFFLGVVDFSLVIQHEMVLAGAAKAGTLYGALEGNSNNLTGMQTVALSAAAAVPGVSVNATTWCTCTAGGTAVDCTSTCSFYDVPIQYVQVSASASVPLLLHVPGLPLSTNIGGSSTMRAR